VQKRAISEVNPQSAPIRAKIVFDSISRALVRSATVVFDARHYLTALNETLASDELNTFAPAPWGEMRPTYLSLWGGIVEYVIQHTMQIAVRKERIREVL
jgi:hypothetical protein